MSIYKLNGNSIEPLTSTSFIKENIREEQDMQKYLLNSINVIDPNLLVISNEFSYWKDSKRRIDILCLDKDANLVIVELKRTEDAGHADLQAIRYASMVTSMKYSDILETYTEYITKNQLAIKDPESEILSFLEWDEIIEKDFANDVRIVLISEDFSKELTTSVLWLNEKDLDIRCVRMKPQKDGDFIFFDIQQIIPLPETSEYQIQLKEKIKAERKSSSKKKRPKFHIDIEINGERLETKINREAIYFVIKNVFDSGITLEELSEFKIKWFVVPHKCKNKEEFEKSAFSINDKYDHTRWFCQEDKIFFFKDKTVALTNQHTGAIVDYVIPQIFKKFPKLNGIIEKYEI